MSKDSLLARLNNMKTSSRRILFVLLAIAFLLGSVAVYSLLIKPTYAQIYDLRAQLVSKSDALARYQTTITKVQELLNTLQDSAQVQRQVSLVLPRERNVSYFANQVVELGAINALSVSSFSTQVAPVKPSASSVIRNVGVLRGEARISGSYAGFKSLLRQLERNILLIDVSDIKIEGTSSGAEQSAGLEYAISLTSYYQTE